MSPAWVGERLDVFEKRLGGNAAVVAGAGAYHEALWRGYDEATALSAGAREAYVNCIKFAIVDEQLWTGGFRSVDESMVHAMGRVTKEAQEVCHSYGRRHMFADPVRDATTGD